MPFNGAGVFSTIYSWVADAAAGIDISASRMDGQESDFATAFDNCLTRDGQGKPTSNLPMAGFRHTGAGNGVALTDYGTMAQIQNPGPANWGGSSSGSGDALSVITYSPAITSLVDGQLCYVRAGGVNTIAAPTFSPNGLPPRVITKFGGAALAVPEWLGDLQELILRYNLAHTRWELLNPTVFAVPVGSVGTAQLQNSAVTYAKIQNVTASRLIGNPTGGPAAPSEVSLGQGLGFSGTSLISFAIAPTTQVLTAGTAATYTTPAGVKWLEILLVGGGSGGGGGNNAVLSTAGGATSFSAFAANGGAGSSFPVVGAGGSASGGYSNNTGNSGSPGCGSTAAANGSGGSGGPSILGGGGAGSITGGTAAPANSGAGGGGGGSSNGSVSGAGGSGGASGGWARAIISAPAATYTYTIGAGGAGAAGSNVSSSVGSAGAAGGSGRIEVIEHY